MDQQDIDSELADARDLLDSTSAGHLAYTAKDGTPRVVTVGFYWTGEQFVISTASTAPKVAALLRLADIVLIWLSVLAMVIAVIVALDSISSANADPGGGTAYGTGSGVGVVAALVMVLVSAARFAVADNDKQSRPAEDYR